MNDIVIQTFISRPEAELASSYLKSHGIPSVVSGGDVGGMRPFPFAYSPYIELRVSQEKAKEAIELLQKLNQS